MTNDDRLRILLRGILGISDADMKGLQELALMLVLF